MLERKDALRAVWHPDRFLQEGTGDGSELRADDAATLDVDKLTAAIRSDKWWFYSEMLVHLHALSNDFSSWAEGCECHGFLRPSRRDSPWRPVYSPAAEQLRIARSMLGLSASDGGDGSSFLCPMAGRRAPDLACVFHTLTYGTECHLPWDLGINA